MFVVDAFIGNPDRNNDNWGLLVTFPEREIIGLAPVYDNGNCLNSKWDDFRMKNFLKEMSNDQKILNSSISIYFDENDDRIRPFNFINQTNIDKCLKSVVSICEKINIDVINSFIEDLYKSKIISELCADFYQKLLTKRYEVALKSNYEYSMEYLHHTHKTKFSGVHLF